MTERERAQYDEEALCKFMGKFMYGITESLFLMGISELIDSQVLFILGTVLMIILIIFAHVYTNTEKGSIRNVNKVNPERPMMCFL